MTDEAKPDREILSEATRWLLKLRDEPQGSSSFTAFEIWLHACERNRTAWDNVNKTWNFLGAAQPAYDDKTWGRERPISQNERSICPAPRRKRRTRHLTFATAIGATATLCLLWFTAPAVLTAIEADYRTGVGQTRLVELSDGSSVELAGATAVTATIDRSRRHISLLEGEVFLDVAHDANRPFIIDAHDLQIRVLGTAFDVRRSSMRTTVALLRGSIHATVEQGGREVQLRPGEQLVFDEKSGEVQVSDTALEDIGAWRDNKIALSDVTIADAVEIIQRYHPAWISIADRQLASRRISGLFDLSDPDKALVAIVGAYGGKVHTITPMIRLVTWL